MAQRFVGAQRGRLYNRHEMAPRPKFTILLAPQVTNHLDSIERKYHGALRESILEQLSHTPTEGTRNRKLLAQPAPFAATWELRCGPNNRYRVFYDVDSENNIVAVLAVGLKDRNRLLIGGEEWRSQ